MTTDWRRIPRMAAVCFGIATLAFASTDVLATSATPGQAGGGDGAALKKAAARFPQPVRTGDLAGRTLIAPTEAQPVLGRVATKVAFKAPDGSLKLLVERGRFGVGSTLVMVPMDDVALVGELVALVGLSPAEFGALPPFAADGATPLSSDMTIRVGIVGPFH